MKKILLLTAFLFSCSSQDELNLLRQENDVLMNRQAKSIKDEKDKVYLVPIVLLSLAPEIKNRLSLHKLDLSKGMPFNANEMALEDIQTGKLNYFIGGLYPYKQEDFDKVFELYNVKVINLASCTEGKAIFSLMESYNFEASKAIKKKHGKTVTEMLQK